MMTYVFKRYDYDGSWYARGGAVLIPSNRIANALVKVQI